jgi:endonuclease/exonuclease/phosphatase family metal-dependent hydrolase
MGRFIVITLFWVICVSTLLCQNDLRIMFYNVENLFDTKDDSLKNDDDFLPDGFMHWTSRKYWEKLRNITRVITAVGEMEPPALIGLCEVENDSVLYDLTKRSPLRVQEYEYIITHSPDERGIDVALLYQRHQFRLLDAREYEIKFSDKRRRPTRNLLHAIGEIINGDTLDLFVCHLPSRSDGQRETEPARIEAAALLRTKTDSLLTLRENASILIMGDFNDHPDNKSLRQTLKARSVQGLIRKDQRYNLFYHRSHEQDYGTYKYQGRWEVLDQFIVTGNLLMEQNSVQVKENKAHIFRAAFLLEEDERYFGKKPFRTNMGPRYLGGFSDHLPIYMDLSIRNL